MMALMDIWTPKRADLIAKSALLLLAVHQLSSFLDLSFWALWKGRGSADDMALLETINYNIEEARMTVPQILTKYGYENEIHKVITEDGYVLELHRVLSRKGQGPAVLLMHPLLCSSAEWILHGPRKSLAYILADLGYDVWIGNARGNTYSRNHTTMDPDSTEFWEFSFHEIGYYDLPASVDYILKTTGQEKLHYIGHSQGGLIFFIMCSLRPEYNEKVLSMTGFAPAVYVYHIESVVGRSVMFLGYYPSIILEWLRPSEFLPRLGNVLFHVANFFCNERAITQPICSSVIFGAVGFNFQQLETSLLPHFLGHTPSGSSIYQIVHFAQGMVSGEFKRLDYGEARNLQEYGSVEPPKYDLSRVTVPAILYCADNDPMIPCKDVQRASEELGNLVSFRRVSDENFNHLDFTWAKDAHKILYDDVIDIIRSYDEV